MLYPAELRDPIFQKKYFKNATKRNINEIFYCRGGRIRTCDLLVPNQARWPDYATPRETYLMSTFRCGETGTRTQATVTRRQISNLLRYHSGTSPFMYMNLLFLFCGCKGITIFHFLQVFCKLFLIFFIKYLVNSYLSNI